MFNLVDTHSRRGQRPHSVNPDTSQRGSLCCPSIHPAWGAALPESAQGVVSPIFSALSPQLAGVTVQGSESNVAPHPAQQVTRGSLCLKGSEHPGPPPQEKGHEVPRAWHRAPSLLRCSSPHPMAPPPTFKCDTSVPPC